jgi:hypothetical protein
VAEIRNGPEEPDRENRPETTAHGDAGAARERVEPRSRAEYIADLERHEALVSFEPRRAGLPDISIADGTAYLDKCWPTRADYPMTSCSRPSTTGTEAIRRFSAAYGTTCTAANREPQRPKR